MKFKTEDKKIFLIVNSYFIGDILLVNPMIQNIKRLYPDSEVIMVTSEKLQDVAKYQEGVDEVIIWDRKGKDKGFFGMLKFLTRLHHKKIYAAFPIYGMDRPILLCKMTNAKYIIAPKGKNIISNFIHSKFPININGHTAQLSNLSLLSGITKEELINVPMSYKIPDDYICKFKIEDPYTVLCPTSTRKSKEIPVEVVCEIIEKINQKVVLVGQGKTIQEYSDYIKNKNYENLIDLTNKTSILDAAAIIKNSKGMISVDTGLMHMACAVKTPVTTVFYETTTQGFKPDSRLYKSNIISENQTAENIIKKYNELLNDL